MAHTEVSPTGQRPRGFTLIELLVVIAIIGLLATIITASLSSARAKGRDARRVSDIRTIQTALELFFNDNYRYPTNIYASSGSLYPNYLAVVPTDPSGAACTSSGTGAGCYRYAAFSSTGGVCNLTTNVPIKYHIGSALEVPANSAQAPMLDVDAPTAGSGSMTGFGYCTASGSGDFNGQTLACSGASLSSTPNDAAVTEGCYDWTN